MLALVFLLPALEASAFVGFVVPGEIAVILGGAAAWRGTVPLWAVITAAVTGAIIGDSAGYLIGRRWGERLLHGTIGRLPVIRRHLDRHLESARAYVRCRRGSAVFFGRFTAALRVLVPGLAGMSQVEYPVFLAYNVAGGALWGTGMAVLGYLAGARYHRVEKIAGRAGLALLALIVIGLVTSAGGGPCRRSMARHGALPHRRPQPWVGDVEQDVGGLAGADQHRVLPDQVGFGEIPSRASPKKRPARVVGNRGEYAGRDHHHNGGNESVQPGHGKKLLLAPPWCRLPAHPGHAAPPPHRARPSVCRM